MFHPKFPMNTLYYGDNLKILRDYIKDESVDLIYLDPPFNSNRNYNFLFKDESEAVANFRRPIVDYEKAVRGTHSYDER